MGLELISDRGIAIRVKRLIDDLRAKGFTIIETDTGIIIEVPRQ